MRGIENDNVEERIKNVKRRLEMRIGRKWRTWSRRVVQDTSEMRIDGMEESCWSKLPPELLREVLVTLERSESVWPMRRNVVACAGVCTTWRDVIKDIAKSPEFNGKITFPISVREPGPRENVIKCFIKRDRSTQMYHLYLSLSNALAEDGKFLLAAQRCRRATCNDYVISINKDDMTRGGGSYIGKLRSNFLGTKFTIYDSQLPHSGTKMMKSWSTRLAYPKQFSSKTSVGNHAVAHISYELNALVGSRAPRRMVCSMDTIPASATQPGGIPSIQKDIPYTRFDSFLSFPFFRSKSNRINNNSSGTRTNDEDNNLVLKNKAPRWHEQLHCWCLNFHGRVTIASVKNFQLVECPHNGVPEDQHEKVILQFGKVGKDVFTMDYCYPISAFQAFAICLSSFHTKIACE